MRALASILVVGAIVVRAVAFAVAIVVVGCWKIRLFALFACSEPLPITFLTKRYSGRDALPERWHWVYLPSYFAVLAM